MTYFLLYLSFCLCCVWAMRVLCSVGFYLHVIILIAAYVFVNKYTHKQVYAFPFSSICVHISRHIHTYFFVFCVWVCVVCACFLLYLSFYLCCARFFCVLFCIHDHLFAYLFLFLQIYLTPMSRCLFMYITLLICLSSLDTCIFLSLIPAYLYLNMYAHVVTRLLM